MALEDTLNVNLNLPEIAPSSSPTEAFDREFSQVNKGITFNNPQPIIGPAVPDTTPDSININENLVGNFQTGPSPGVKNTSGGTIDFVKAVNSYMGQADVWAKDKYKYGRTYSYGAGHRNMNFERYYNHPQFEKLGFSPYRNNEQLYNENSSWMDDFRRMGTQYGKLFAAGFGSSLFLVDDDEAAEAMEKGMAIGSSSKEGVGAWITNFGLNSAYTMGIMTEIVIEDIGLAALEGLSLGTATPLVGAELARQGMLLGKGIKAVEKTKDALKALTDLNKAKELWNFGKLGEKTVDFAKAVNPLQRTFDYTANLAKNTNSFDKLSNVAKTTKGFGAFYRDIREISLAVEEGGMEAAMASNEYHQRLIDEYYAENGTMPEGKAAQDIYEKANSVRASVQMWNNLVIYGSNKLTIGKLLDGFPAASVLVKGLEDTTTRTLGKVARKEVLQKGAYEFAEKTFAKKAKDFVTKSPYLPWTLPYITGNLSEALQENAQEAIQKGVISYYDKIDKDPSQAGFWEGINHMGAALGTQWSGEGLNTFMSGFLMGSLAGGVQGGVFKAYQGTKSLIPAYKAEFEKAKQTAIEREDAIINAANAIAKDAMNVGQHNADRMAAARNHAADMNNAVEEQDEYKYNNAKDNLASEEFYTLASTGKMNLITDHFDGMLKASNEELAEAYGKKPEEAPAIRKRLETLKERANSFQKKYDTAVKELPNPNDLSLFDPKKQPELYREVLNKYNAWNEAVKSVVISTEAAERISGRIINIATEFSRVSPWIETRKGATMSNTAGVNDAMAFIDRELRANEITTLRAEVEALKDGTPEQKAKAKIKEKKLKSYQTWSEKLDSLNRELLRERKGQGDKIVLDKFIDELYNQFKEHINIVAEENGGVIKDKEADKAFKKIVDFYMLETDSQQLTKAINTLSNPQYFSRYYQAQQVVQAKRAAERDKSLREAHAKYVELAKTNDFLNELYDLGLFILPEEIDNFKKDPESVTYFDKNNKKPVEPTDAVYEKIKDILKRYFPKAQEVKVEEKVTKEEEVSVEEKIEEVQPGQRLQVEAITPNTSIAVISRLETLRDRLVEAYRKENNNRKQRKEPQLQNATGTWEEIVNTEDFKSFLTTKTAIDILNDYNEATNRVVKQKLEPKEVTVEKKVEDPYAEGNSIVFTGETTDGQTLDKVVGEVISNEGPIEDVEGNITSHPVVIRRLDNQEEIIIDLEAENADTYTVEIYEEPVIEEAPAKEVTGEVPPEVAARIDLVSKFGLDQAEVDKMTTDQVLEKYAELTEEAPVSDRKTEIENKIKSIEDEIGSLNYFIGGTDSYAATVQAEKDIKRLEEDIKKLKEELSALEGAKPVAKPVEEVKPEVKIEEGPSLQERLDTIDEDLAYLYQDKELAEISVEAGEDLFEMIVFKNMPKISPESAEKETGTKVGRSKDISNFYIKTDGVTVEEASEEVWADLDEDLQNQYSDYDIRNIIIEILTTPPKEFKEKFSPKGKLNDINRKIKDLEAERKELTSPKPKKEKAKKAEPEVVTVPEFIAEEFPKLRTIEELKILLNAKFADPKIREEFNLTPEYMEEVEKKLMGKMMSNVNFNAVVDETILVTSKGVRYVPVKKTANQIIVQELDKDGFRLPNRKTVRKSNFAKAFSMMYIPGLEDVVVTPKITEEEQKESKELMDKINDIDSPEAIINDDEKGAKASASDLDKNLEELIKSCKK